MKYLITLLMLLCFAVGSPAQGTGAADRKYWVETLYKIAYPVMQNLAAGTLKQNMPLELGPGYGGNVKAVTYLEAVGRTMAGIAPWLALPDDNTPEGLQRKNLRSLVLQGLPHAVDPANPDYLNFRTEQQPIVDAAFLAQAFLRAPNLWSALDSVTQKRFITEFQSLRDRKAGYNNWLLFAGITEAFLAKTGASYDPARIDIAYRKFREWYVGDGWYSDGDKFAMDYYNSFVIHPMLVDMLAVMVDKKMVQQPEYDLAIKRMVRYAEWQERAISPEGYFTVMGRSMAYRNAAFQALGQVALMEKMPGFIEPAQVRCALTKVAHNIFDHAGTFSANGWLQLGFVGHQPELADTYTSTGSLYLCTVGFLPLGLPASNRFWTDPPADWTSKRIWQGEHARKDYKVDY
ncbi:DUF2264 domain-containing protein [Flavihumibacter profundi]|uniref:DUF2264 domain-containing protein n=1 Tax=Flavihumibacter profundi TaxID=2716883 RepID=UPI001CC614D6|nr:DUF2264 domain-containing protein [Flavihumibacter profundi]MBZ5858401.1 DUF2264 domain-containing protein [Flavihumibacter profundi]